MASQKREQAPALQGRPRTRSPLAAASGLYKGRRNPRTDLKVGHYKPKRKAPASEGGLYRSTRAQKPRTGCVGPRRAHLTRGRQSECANLGSSAMDQF